MNQVTKVSGREALEQFVNAVARTSTERMTAPHPAFGRMTHDEWVVLNLRHCELHLSFAVPGDVVARRDPEIFGKSAS